MEKIDVLYSVLQPNCEYVVVASFEAESVLNACGQAQAWITRQTAEDGIKRNLIAVAPLGGLDDVAWETNQQLSACRRKASDA